MFYGEDLALSLQIEQLGGRLIFAAKSGVQHRRRTTFRSVARQAFCMGRARARLTRLNRGHFELIYTLPALITVGAAVLSVLCLLWPGFRPPGVAAALTGAAYLGFVGIAAALSKRAAAVALLAPVVFVIQLLAYGLGFLGGAVVGVQKEGTGLGFG